MLVALHDIHVSNRAHLRLVCAVALLAACGDNTTPDLDVNWKSTFEEYYEGHDERIFDDAADVLDAEPNFFYSEAEMEFLAE